MKSIKLPSLNHNDDFEFDKIATHKIYFTKDICDYIFLENADFEVVEINVADEGIAFASETVIKLKSHERWINKIQLPFDFRVLNSYIKVGQIIQLGTLLFEVQKADDISNFHELAFQFNVKKLQETSVSIFVDDFTKEKSIFFTQIAGQETKYFETYSDNSVYPLGLTFENNNGFVYMKFKSASPTFNLSKGDGMIILFDDDSTMSFSFIIKSNMNKSSGLMTIYTNVKHLTLKEIEQFARHNLKKIKLTSKKNGLYDVYHLEKRVSWSPYKSQIEAQYLLKYMVALFVKQHIDNNMEITNN